MDEIKISPSLLAADFSRLAEEIQAVERAGASALHLDPMDGHFVPNITLGPDQIKALRKTTSLPFDAHLMISPVDPYVDAFVGAGCQTVTVHAEATTHLDRTLSLVRDRKVKVGVALNPTTPLSVLDYLLDKIDMVLIMTINPGFGGQSFLPEMCQKIEILKKMIGPRPVEIQVDGGINSRTAPLVVRAGARNLVAGTAVYGQKDYGKAIKDLREAAQQGLI